MCLQFTSPVRAGFSAMSQVATSTSMLPRTIKMPIALCLFFSIMTSGNPCSGLAALHLFGQSACHTEIYCEVTQLKQLDVELRPRSRNLRVNYSVRLEDVAGRCLFSRNLDTVPPSAARVLP